jgi:hypothetical protein
MPPALADRLADEEKPDDALGRRARHAGRIADPPHPLAATSEREDDAAASER